jgi:hypothetical protein
MSEAHEACFSGLAILIAKHQDLELDDSTLTKLLNVEAYLPAVLASALKGQITVTPAELKRLKETKIRPTLEASDDALGANGDLLKLILAFIEKMLPIILPLFVKTNNT